MTTFSGEYKRYKKLLERSIEQISEKDFFRQPGDQCNSIAVILKHISGNLLSRFTDFLSTDGEKPWRERESEFNVDGMTKDQIVTMWTKAWGVLEESVFDLNDGDLKKKVKIRGIEFSVEEALARSLSHFSYHVGQIVYLAKLYAGKNWKFLSIPPGGSQTYNQNPAKEKGL